jgi:hypothetical protein
LHIQPFWLDAVCGQQGWEVALSYSKDEKIIGVLPYFKQVSKGLTFVKMPPFTDYLGPWIHLEHQEEMKQERKYIKYKQILSDLIAQLPNSTYFFQQLHPNCEDWLPFMQARFQQTTYYTYQIELKQAVDTIFGQFRRNIRRNITTADSYLSLEESFDPRDLYQLVSTTFQQQGIQIGFSMQQLERLVAGLKDNKQGVIYYARNKTNHRRNAAVLLAWDDTQVFTILSASAEMWRDKPAPSWLNWQIIQGFVDSHQTLDFCGSIIPEIEHATIGMGGKRVPFYKIYKSKNLFWYLLAKLAKTEYA